MNLAPKEQERVREAVAGLDSWLDSMRQPGGYGGPVAHWWQDCLDYTGPGLDWRYEGIITGYLNLWAATGEDQWLAKARRAGDDLLDGQLPSGNFRNSCFEQNPNTGGTPHEAACDLALLRLAEALRSTGSPECDRYAEAAEWNLKGYFIDHLWDPVQCSFRDHLTTPSFVSNKACTLVEALFALSRYRRVAKWAEEYALLSLDAVLAHQVSGGKLDGAICQNSFENRKIEKFFPYYIARCLPALIQGYEWSGEERFADAARRAAGFILRYRYIDGSFPQVVYPLGQVNRYPQWVAGAGDVLRALDLCRRLGITYDEGPTLQWLLAGRRADGAFRTGVGFGKAVPGDKNAGMRDSLAVVGWNDKAFRFLTGLLLSGAQTNTQ
jgi:hypothetical protein